jgi:acyl-CoA hydrolase
MEFLYPVKVGDLIITKASVNWVGTTSMEVGCRVEVENLLTGERKQVGRAYLTFVAIDNKGKPIPAPKILPETKDAERRFEQAQDRRKLRLKHRELMKIKYRSNKLE